MTVHRKIISPYAYIMAANWLIKVHQSLVDNTVCVFLSPSMRYALKKFTGVRGQVGMFNYLGKPCLINIHLWYVNLFVISQGKICHPCYGHSQGLSMNFSFPRLWRVFCLFRLLCIRNTRITYHYFLGCCGRIVVFSRCLSSLHVYLRED